jgi:succinate-semialdehyde dehydrogenase/glutarate-semialdehyde dehydrogenase
MNLLHDTAFINGKWVKAQSGEVFEVKNPATREVISRVPDMGEQDVLEAISAAYSAFETWKSTSTRKRSKILRAWYDLIRVNADNLAQLITAEMGKPAAEAKGEVLYGASFVEWFAEEAKRGYGDVIPAPRTDQRMFAIKQPVGVVAAITPWNFPVAMITRKVAPALAAGCTVVIKPAEDTPLSALALAELGVEAGIPEGVFNVVTTNKAPEVGKILTSDSRVRKISFTGSTEVGKILMSQSASTVKKVSLELGGNAPFIVFDDADIDAAVAGAINAKYRNTGQTCICANRIYVQDAVYDEFAEKFAAEMKKLKMGNGTEEGVRLGPLINKEALEKVNRLVVDAVEKGANVVTGGKPSELGGTFYEPTVLTDVTMEMACATTEIFGPVAPLYRFQSEDEVIRMANDTPYGLAAYFYARDNARIWRVAEGLEYGMVGINEGAISNELGPFGGVKESGIGREGSKYGMDEFMEMKYLCMGGI